MMNFLPPLLVFLIALPASTFGQGTASSALDAFPDCAAKCILSSFQAGPCTPADQACICTNEAFQANVTQCVALSCTIPEALATKNASLTNCGAPVRDRSRDLIILSDTMAAVAAFFIVIRFSYKLFVIKLNLGLDDWFVMATMIAAAPSAFITVYGTTANGLGKDIWTLSATEITNVLKYFYIMAALYFLQTTLVKLSIISFYMRIFPSRNTQRLLWVTFGFTTLWGIAFVFAAIFQCRPIDYFWTHWDGLHSGQCVDANAIAWSNAAMNIALDLWILAIPLWQLRSLQLHWKKKIGVALMFGVGTFVTVMSILRLRSLVTFAAKTNSTWEFFDVSMWSTIEICVGIVCACLPTVRLLLVKVFPMLAGSTRRFTGSYLRRYGGEGGSGSSGVRGHSVRVVTDERPASTPYSEGQPGIVFHKSYTVQYSDNDEISLVRMSDLRKSDERRWHGANV